MSFKVLLPIFMLTFNCLGLDFSEIESMINRNRVDSSITVIEKIPNDSWQYKYLLGRLKFSQSLFDDAEDLFEEALEENKNSYLINFYLKRSIFEGSDSFFGFTGRLNDYINAIDLCFEKEPNKYAKYYIPIIPVLAVMPSMGGGDKERSDLILKKLSSLKESYYYDLSKIYIEIFKNKIAKKGNENIIKLFSDLEVKFPNKEFTKEYYNLTYKVDKAYQDGYDFNMKFDHPINNFYLGYYQTKLLNNIDNGIKMLENYLNCTIDLEEGYPTYSAAHRQLALLYNSKGDKKKALYHIDEAIRLNPGREDVYDEVRDEIEE
ncbi:MAG: hypothetical protein CSA15_11200 [Candidatus Delongbacteria bacterium]|nr:MAG: hypothetical protein CSA15_11200 [Candidatus Delongbacteria bacterium]